MKQIVPIVLTALMLTSLFAAIDFADELKDTNEMETSGHAAYELKLHDVLEPRETFVDAGGNTRNGIDIGDTVYFLPIIINDGETAHEEFNIRVTVTPAGDNMPAEIDNLDDAVCPGTTSVTGCSFNTLAPGDFLGGGNYRVQAESGGDLAWNPTIPGEYTIHVSIEVDGSMDDDLTNNDESYTVVVQHYRDIVVDLCWTDGNECTTNGHQPVQGAGPHPFAVMVTADGSEAWQPRATTMTVEFGGSYDTDVMNPSNLDTDGSGPNSPVAASAGGHTFTFEVGDSETVDVWHNVSDVEPTVTDANDLADNPCANGDNPCREARTVMTFGTTYTFHGVMAGDEAQSGSATASFTIQAVLAGYDSYEPAAAAAGGGGPAGGGGEEDNSNSIILEEVAVDYDDRTGNNDGRIAGSFSVFHDVGITSLTGGDNEATEGTMNVGVTQLRASVIYGGSSESNAYDWSVSFTVEDENGQSAIQGDGTALECLDEDPERSYSHTTLGNMVPAMPEGTACLEVDLQSGRYTVTASITLESAGSTPDTATDMNSGNNQRSTFFEVINGIPNVYVTLDDITRGDESVDAPVVVGDWITMRARGSDIETIDEELMYTWTRITANGETLPIDGCDVSICTVETDMSWIGERNVFATVTDGNMASASDSMLMSVWNSYSMDEFFDSGAVISYSLVYGPIVNYSVTASESGMAFTQQQLGNNAGAFDSTLVFGLDVTNVMMPADIGAESLTINFDGDATSPWGLWFKRTADSPWINVEHVTTAAGSTSGVSMNMAHDGGLQGNIAGGTYAIFDVATSGDQPPATGVAGLTADLQPDSRVVFNWGYGDDSLLNTGTDTVNVYHCAGEGCDAMAGTAMPSMQVTTLSWTLIGTDAESYTVVVQTENGNTDAVTGATLSGGSASITVVADGSVSPAPTLTNAASTVTSSDDGLTFTWDAADTGDVSSWVLCWAGTQDIVENSFDGLLGNSCAETEDTTSSITVTEQTMCGGTCSSKMYFGMAGKDATGNVADPGALLYADMSDGLHNPGVIDSTDPGAGDEDGGIGNAIYAIIGLVVLAVIGGAFILTRGADADGDEKEWDY